MSEPWNEPHVCIECGREEENIEQCCNCEEWVCEHCWIETDDEIYCSEECYEDYL